MGEWTTIKPTEPGWYKAYLPEESGVEFVEVYESYLYGVQHKPGATVLRVALTNLDITLSLNDVEWWWSEPEELPEAPE
jgi:hypothetical protein